MGLTDEARKWFQRGTSTFLVRTIAASAHVYGNCQAISVPHVWCAVDTFSPFSMQGQASHALWVSWALMEAQQGDATAVRYLFKRGMEVGPRSRLETHQAL